MFYPRRVIAVSGRPKIGTTRQDSANININLRGIVETESHMLSADKIAEVAYVSQDRIGGNVVVPLRICPFH